MCNIIDLCVGMSVLHSKLKGECVCRLELALVQYMS
jgi:hypothetical protein